MTFVPDPHRAVFITEPITPALVARLAPEILELRAAGDGPVTVYLNSPGGSTAAVRAIMDLLRAPSADGEAGRVIAVVIGWAESAAADLLASSDHAIAYPNAQILLHGCRQRTEELTADAARDIESQLQAGNESFAQQLAPAIFRRLLGRFERLGSAIRETRESLGDELGAFDILLGDGTFDVPALICTLERQLEPPLGQIAIECMDRARTLTEILTDLRIQSETPADLGPTLTAATTAHPRDSDPAALHRNLHRNLHLLHLLHLIIASQLRNDPEWMPTADSLMDVVQDLDELLPVADGHFEDGLLRAMLPVCPALMSPEDREFVLAADAPDLDDPVISLRLDDLVARAYRKVVPLWTYSLTLSRRLNLNETALDARSAWWLGLLDEVIGSEPGAESRENQG